MRTSIKSTVDLSVSLPLLLEEDTIHYGWEVTLITAFSPLCSPPSSMLPALQPLPFPSYCIAFFVQ